MSDDKREKLPSITLEIPAHIWELYCVTHGKLNPRTEIKMDFGYFKCWDLLWEKKTNGGSPPMSKRATPTSRAAPPTPVPPTLDTEDVDGDLDAAVARLVPAGSQPSPSLQPLLPVSLMVSRQKFKEQWPKGGETLLEYLVQAYSRGGSGYWDSRYATPPGKPLTQSAYTTIDMLEKAIDEKKTWDEISEAQQKWIFMARDMCRFWLGAK